jgi:tRNA pseudouridine55 synthase
VPDFDAATLAGVLQRFRGRTSQIPPMYSAIKRDGQPLYKLARAGVEVERKPRDIDIAELTVVTRAGTRLELEALCSKGTYIRVLAEDIARALGTCGHVVELRRLSVEPFETAAMQTMEEVTARAERGEAPVLIAPDLAIPHLPVVHLSAASAARVMHGQAVAIPPEAALPAATAPQAETAPQAGTAPQAAAALGRVRLYDAQGRFFGLGEVDGFGQVQPRRLFVVGS